MFLWRFWILKIAQLIGWNRKVYSWMLHSHVSCQGTGLVVGCTTSRTGVAFSKVDVPDVGLEVGLLSESLTTHLTWVDVV